jgi:hypothetical protein
MKSLIDSAMITSFVSNIAKTMLNYMPSIYFNYIVVI